MRTDETGAAGDEDVVGHVWFSWAKTDAAERRGSGVGSIREHVRESRLYRHR